METAYYNTDYESTTDNRDGQMKESVHIRRLTFEGSYSPMTLLGENTDEMEFEFLMDREKKQSDHKPSNVCYRRLCFGNDDEKDDPFFPCLQLKNRDYQREINDSAKRSLCKILGPCPGDPIMESDMEFESASKSLLVKQEYSQLRGKDNFGGSDEMFATVVSHESRDDSQLGFTTIPPETSLDPSSICFKSTPRKFLPTCKSSRNPGLSTITPQTLYELMCSEDQRSSYMIVDCRYDYEYHGGHIKGAIHVDTPEKLKTLFIKNKHLLLNRNILNAIKENPSLLNSPYVKEQNVPIIIFHCEFSQKRGPRALRMLREIDQNINSENWPNVYYPEVYILEGGYSNFRLHFPECCVPENGYIRMIDERYRESYCIAREKEKNSWGSTGYSSKSKLKKPLTLQRSKTMIS